MGKWLRKMKASEGSGLGGDEAQTRRTEGSERQGGDKAGSYSPQIPD